MTVCPTILLASFHLTDSSAMCLAAGDLILYYFEEHIGYREEKGIQRKCWGRGPLQEEGIVRSKGGWDRVLWVPSKEW